MAVCVGVRVCVGEAVAVGVFVGLAVLVAVKVGVLVAADSVCVAVAVCVTVAVGVRVGVKVGVKVGVSVAAPPCVSMISCGSFADSRLARLRAVLFVVDRARLKTPLPVMKAVTSSVVQVLALTFPEEPSPLPGAGALLKLMPVSLQVLSLTPNAW